MEGAGVTDEQKAAYAAGWRAGAEKMRDLCIRHHEEEAAAFRKVASKNPSASVTAHDTREAARLHEQHADALAVILHPPVQYPEAARDGE
jgi:hypothetical protein